MRKQLTKNLIIYLLSIGLIFVLFIFLLGVNIISYGVKDKCQLAQEKYPGDCVEALSNYLDDESNSYQSRNSAIWALGQLGDSRALPILKKYYTEYNGERISRNQTLAQLELKRAIKYLEGGLNITTYFWRFGNDID